MPRVFNLCNILQFIIDRFYQARFLSKILSATVIREFLMLFFILVINCMPLKKRFSNKACPI